MNARCCFAVLLAGVVLAWGVSQAETSSKDSEWPVEIRTEHRPGTYWWCPGSAFDQESIDWNLEGMSQAGIGTAHIVPIYGAKGYEERYIEYLSPEWVAMLDYIVTKARGLGMNIDMTTGTGWCFGGPGLDKRTGDLVAVYDAEKKTLSFKPGRNVKRSAPGGEGLMLNPYSPAAMRLYLERFSKAFDAGQPAMPRAQYHDSFEYAGDWSLDLFEEFKARRGYDLEEYLDTFFSEGAPSEEQGRLKCDYRETLAELHYESIRIWAAWARERGMITRNQAHGGPTNLLDLYAVCNVPETEMFGAPEYPIPGFRRDPAMTRPGDSDPRIARMASSAAHVAHTPGRQLVSSESCTWLREHWHTALAQAKLELDQFFLAGVNHVFYHGNCYSPKDAPWPGWFFYASTKFDSRNSIWRDFPVLNRYVARCQSILQAGVPANDVLVYWPIYDLWSKPEGTRIQCTVHDPVWMAEQPFGILAQTLLEQGYAFDFVSDRMLASIESQGGAIEAPGGSYRVLVVPACRVIPSETLARMAALAEQGATVIFEQGLPGDVPGLARLEERREQLAAERSRLEAAGAMVTADVLGALAQAQVKRESLVDQGLSYIRRKTDDGYYYFLANQSATVWDGWLGLAMPMNAATLLDPMTGACGTLSVREPDGEAQVYVQIQPGESVIVATYALAGTAPWRYLEAGGDAVVVDGPWQVDFIEGGPELPDPVRMERLASWTEAADARAQAFAGTARYSVTFTVPEGADADEWLLDLGDVRESARVSINGQDAGALIALPFRLRVGAFIKPGENRLAIEVTNLAANRIRALEQSGADWKVMKDINIVNVNYKDLGAGAWPVVESGLLGPVRLVPMRGLAP